MKCPACVGAGTPSRLDVHQVPKQPMPVERFYDEDGALHVHDHTAYRTVHACTNGHAYQQIAFSRCPHKPCSWNTQAGVLAGEQALGYQIPDGPPLRIDAS